MQLDELRKIIDQIDEKIVQLISERCKIAGKVGVWKIENGHPIFVPEREKQLYQKLKQQNPGSISDESLINIYREIISGAIAVEQPLKIGYTLIGIPELLRHPARLTFGDSAQYLCYDSVHTLFSSIENGECDYAVVPFYDGKECFFSDTVDALITTDRDVVAERISPLNGSTALIIGQQSPSTTGDDRTALRVQISDTQSSLEKVLDIFKELSINIICCELRISQSNSDMDSVFIEIEGYPTETDVKTALYAIEKIADKTEVIGGFPVL